MIFHMSYKLYCSYFLWNF